MDDCTRFPPVPPISGDAVPPEPRSDPPSDVLSDPLSGPLSDPLSDRSPPTLRGAEETARKLFSYWPFLLVVLRRGGVPDRDVADVAQQVLLAVLFRAVRAPPGGSRRPVGVWRAYLRAAAARAAGRYCRREAERAERLGWAPGLDAGGEPSPSPEDVLLAREVVEKLEPASATTPERWRALHAFVVTGIPVPVIAQAEQVPAGTVRTRILLARRDLRAALRRRRLL